MPIDQYFKGLFGMVAKTISEFKQGEHTGDKPVAVRDEKQPNMMWTMPPKLHAAVKGGFCHGASLDWLRKVIQREDPVRFAITHRKFERVSRMAQTHVEHNAAKSAAADLVGARAKSEIAASNEARKGAVAAAKAQLAAWARGNGCVFEEDAAGGMTVRDAPTPEIHAMIDGKFNEFQESVRKAGQAASQRAAASNAVVGRWNAATPAERLQMSWGDIASLLGTDATKTRKFSGITPVAGNSSNTFADLRTFIVDAVAAPAFTAGRGILLSFDFVPEPGHSIAAHKEAEDSYVLFDPNLGVYRCRGLARFVTALVVLIEECYLAPDEGRPPETSLGSKHSWHVFCRTDELVPGAAATSAASPDDARIAVDNAAAARDSYATTMEFVVRGALEEAQQKDVAFKQAMGPSTQRPWVDAHNEAVQAVVKSRMSDAEAKRTYGAFKRSTISLR